jgi:UDP-glucose 4-epimerase
VSKRRFGFHEIAGMLEENAQVKFPLVKEKIDEVECTVNLIVVAVIPRFIREIRLGNPPVTFTNGGQTTDFAFAKDIVNANIPAAQSDNNGIFNICFGESVTVNRLAELITELIGSKVRPIHRETRSSDIKYSVSDISRAESFGYKP